MYEPQTLVNDAEHYGISVTAVADLKPGDWYYQVIMVHHYTPQENDGRHNLYMTVLDENGERVVGAKVAVLNHGNNQTTYVTCDKPISEPAGNCQLNPQDRMSCSVDGSAGESAGIFHTQWPAEPPPTAWGHNGNDVSHHSFLVLFKRVQVQSTEPSPGPEPEGDFTAEDMERLTQITNKVADMSITVNECITSLQTVQSGMQEVLILANNVLSSHSQQ